MTDHGKGEVLVTVDAWYKTASAVMLLLIRTLEGKQEVLLQRRQNTGYADGLWDCAASGRVEANESMTAAVIREAREEIGIEILPGQVQFATLMHVYSVESGETYHNAFFTVSGYRGIPAVMEPNKCAALAWFDIDDLPSDLIPNRALAIANYLAGVAYDETGWDRSP